MRLASGLARAVTFMLAVDTEPPTDRLRSWTEIYREDSIRIYIYTASVYICICIHTDTNNHYTTHACNRHSNKEGTTQPEQQALALRTSSVPELGFVPPSLGNGKYPFDTKRKMFSKTIDMIHYAFAVS